MSLDVSLYRPEKTKKTCPHCNSEYEEQETVFDYNITHNLGGMAERAGVYQYLWRPEDMNIKVAKDLIKPLEIGLETLLSSPEIFKVMNPENGWGNYEGLVEFVKEYLRACKYYPDSIIYVSR